MLESSVSDSALGDQHVHVAIIEPHDLLRCAMTRECGALVDIEVSDAIGNCRDVERVLSTTNATVVIFGVSLPMYECLHLTDTIRHLVPGLGIVVVRAQLTAETVSALIRTGVHAILGEVASERDLATAINLAADGDTYLSQRARDLFRVSATSVHDLLTRREREVLILLAHGRSNDEIAQALGARRKTVETHLTRIYDKLGVRSRVEAILRVHESDIALSVTSGNVLRSTNM